MYGVFISLYNISYFNLLLDTERLEFFLNTKILFHILENLLNFVHLMHFRMFY